MIELKNLGKIYKSKKSIDTEALKNINIKFDNKGMTFILGKSGCGKSTLLNILGGLDIPTSGEVLYNGKSFKDYKESDYDSYRNEVVGFVFQEYNLIEKFNVFENVAYPLKLQNNKIDENKIIDALNKVGLAELKDRKVNELSGGQKQRVAIARALVKNPKVILADEPTGNLDSESAKGIFELLKELSSNILVIVISHDEESAKIYSDRIVFLQDGVITGVTSNNEIELINDSNTKVKNKLPIKEVFGIGLKNLGKRKGKLILSVILIAISLSLFGLAVMQSFLKTKEESVRLMDEFDAQYFEIIKLNYQKDRILPGYWINSINADGLSEEDYKNVIEKYGINGTKVNSLKVKGIGSVRFIPAVLDTQKASYYDGNVIFGLNGFTELDKDDFDFKMIGNKPSNYEEIVITKQIADVIIRHGIYEYEEKYDYTPYVYKNELDTNRSIFKPSSYEEIINSDKYISYGNGKLKIVGIVDYDTSQFEKLQNIKMIGSQDVDIVKLQTKFELSTRVAFYALKGFKDNFNPKILNTIKVTLNKEQVLLEEDYKNVYNLKKNEVIIPLSYIDLQTNGEFTLNMNKYMSDSKDLDPSKSMEEYKKEYIEKYITDNNIIDKEITFVQDNETRVDNVKLLIKGYSEGNNYIVSKDYMSQYEVLNYGTDYIVPVTNKEEYNEALSKLSIEGEEFALSNGLLNVIAESEHTMLTLQKYFYIISNVFMIFALLQLFSYINATITDSKKEIGILRSLGTKKMDIAKIYIFQGLIVTIISYVFALVLCYLFSNFENNMIFNSYYTVRIFDLHLVGITWQSALIMIVFILIVTILSSLKVVRKLTKLKPVDLINDK